jgi:uncharacterized membrane protein HdeD (DUF308 family)
MSLVLIAAAASWITCAGLGAYVSAAKCRPALEGFFFGVLLGPLGILVAALLPANPAPAAVNRWPVGHPMRARR